MVTCVECGKFVPETHREFKGKGNIRLTKCVGIDYFAKLAGAL